MLEQQSGGKYRIPLVADSLTLCNLAQVGHRPVGLSLQGRRTASWMEIVVRDT